MNDDQNKESTDSPDQPTPEEIAQSADLAFVQPSSVPIAKKPFFKKPKVWATILVLVVIGLGLGGYYYHSHKTTPAAVSVKKATAVKPVTPLAANTFFATPTKLTTDLAFFKDTTAYFGTTCTGANGTDCSPSVKPSDISYYQIGTTAKKQPIVVAEDYGLGEGDFSYVAIETSSGHFSVLGKQTFYVDPTTPNSQTQITDSEQSLAAAFSPNVTLDTTTTLPELTFPLTTTINGLAIKTGGYGSLGYFMPSLAYIRGSFFAGAATTTPTMTKLGQLNDKTYYEVTAEDSANYQVKEIDATVNQVYATSYSVADSLTADKPAIVWTNKSTNQNTYTAAAGGCGSSTGYVVAKDITPSQLTAVGTGPDGQTLYDLAPSTALFNEIYGTDYAGGTDITDSSMQNLTATEFQNEHAFFLAKNALGEYVVYERTDFFIKGGCGKPVIYLYPQQPTTVNVSVDADITNSSPLYSQTGWQGVVADPSGKLSYQGQTYDSLYWEGTGAGTYPAITAGSVVATSKAVPTIRTQLAEQGLAPHEINDFLAFWQPRLPDTPYVRLTWFNTAQMNNLAPLNITPRPSTLLRVFLDFQGLNKPISLTPQKFSAPVRKGFTVVEWGGLLRGN